MMEATLTQSVKLCQAGVRAVLFAAYAKRADFCKAIIDSHLKNRRANDILDVMDEEELRSTLVDHFQWLHRHPELSRVEYNTTAYIGGVLEKAGIEILKTGLKTGLAARIKGGKEGRVIALRADIDALPVIEETGLEYASENHGVMHACGHDFHTAALIGAALLLKKAEEEISGEVLFVFQPAEEVSGGAAGVIETGVLDDVDEIYGLHAAAEYESGVVALKEGGTFAAVAAFKINIAGKGGHAALPHQCYDPVVAACALITLAQTVVSRNSDPFDQVVLSFTHIEAGKTWNVIPAEAFIEGTIRTLSSVKAHEIAARLKEISHSIEISHQVKVSIDWWMDTPATNNDADLTSFIAKLAKKMNYTVKAYTPTMAGEDFALYQEKIRGVFFNFGVDSPHGLHHPQFIARASPDDAARLLAALAFERGKRD
jgi:amidohydrolase